MLPKFEQLDNRVIVVERTGGEPGITKRQRDTLKGLGLRKIGVVVEVVCSRDVFGMLLKVSHMIKVNLK
ncbi:MAG: 50S ribosomal protein L30 [Rickettsiales bacterium]|nr:50S ribosomal protein L30 [Rickettsiales bacterium]